MICFIAQIHYIRKNFCISANVNFRIKINMTNKFKFTRTFYRVTCATSMFVSIRSLSLLRNTKYSRLPIMRGKCNLTCRRHAILILQSTLPTSHHTISHSARTSGQLENRLKLRKKKMRYRAICTLLYLVSIFFVFCFVFASTLLKSSAP